MKHSKNIHIQQLVPLVAKALKNGLTAIQVSEQVYSAKPIEQYAHKVYSRVLEIDNAFKNIDISLEYLKKSEFVDSQFKFSEHHSFHVENYLLRLTSVIDRSFLLVGSSICMSDKDIEDFHGKKEISKKLKEFSPKAARILKKMNNQIRHLKIKRNKVAHQSGYSNKNLCVVELIEESKEEFEHLTSILSLNELKEIVISNSVTDFEQVTASMHDLVDELIGSLAFFYQKLLEPKG
ncbi:hypothetical protein VCR15J2_470038 [Vibrio coralliirubri]|uniref:hypothetical protein n=1 Tax=Vibrio coralliirubri TaxID=1516159 RepID=UPI0006376C07|nr:hypothetical protein [Vibrio coralliirubri]CDT62433.1 hypothetical protein VCR15J2_470038 [Vibrio coralliirubri]